MQPVTQLCNARIGAEDDNGVQGKHPPTSLFRSIAGLSYVLASPEQEGQGLNIFPRQSEAAVLFEDEVLDVEAVERQPPP